MAAKPSRGSPPCSPRDGDLSTTEESPSDERNVPFVFGAGDWYAPPVVAAALWSSLGVAFAAVPGLPFDDASPDGERRPTAPWVLVPEPEGEACVLHAPIATQLERTPGLIVSRGASDPSDLSVRRRALGATYAVRARRISSEEVEVEVEGDARIHRARAKDPSVALERAWPAEAPRLGPEVRPPNLAALEAACEGHSDEALRHAGAALGTLLPRLTPFRDSRPSAPLFTRWAQALATAPSTESVRLLNRILLALERGEIAPFWRRLPRTATAAPSALALQEGAVHLFEAGFLARVDLGSGQDIWRTWVGRAEPIPLALPGGPLLVARTDGVSALSRADGRKIWETKLKGIHPEVAARGDILYAAGAEDAISLDRATGAVRWRTALPKKAVAGPRDLGARIAIPLETAVLFVDPASGRPIGSIVVPDGVAGPLEATPNGYLWVLIGSDGVKQLDPERGSVRARITGIPGIAWPPLLVGERLVVLTPSRRRSRLRWLDALAPRGRRAEVPAEGPVVLRPDFSGVLHLDGQGRRLVGRDAVGTEIFRLALPRAGQAIATFGARAVVGMGDRALVVDVDRARRLFEVRFEAPVLDVVLGAEGGAALLSDGVVYGWPGPGDPRSQALLQTARLDLAEIALASGRAREAKVAAEAALARSPESLTAQVLRARALEAERPRDAVPVFLEIQASAPRGSPPEREAVAALARLGLEPLSDDARAGLHPSGSEASPSSRELEVNGEVLTRAPTSSTSAAWRVELGFSPFEARRVGDRAVVTGSDRVVALDVESGRRAWQYRLPGEEVRQLDVVEGALLVWTNAVLHRIDPARGRREGRVRLTGAPKLIAHSPRGPVALAYDGAVLAAIEIAGPRLLGRAEIPDVVDLIPEDDRVLARLGDGRWLAIDPKLGLGGP